MEVVMASMQASTRSLWEDVILFHQHASFWTTLMTSFFW